MPQDTPPIDLVLVDFDDTLVRTAPRFSEARRRFFALLEAQGFPTDVILQVHYDEVDPVMRDRYGFGPQRMGHAFRETYRRLCQRAATPLDDELAARCARLGDEVAGPPPAIAGAMEALRRLALALPTVVYTLAGDPAYQLECLREAGALGVVGEERIRVVAAKTPETLRRAMADFGARDPSRVWMVGNSMRSDINPALAIGANAILVEVDDPWHHDVVEPMHNGFRRVDSFAAAVELLLAW